MPDALPGENLTEMTTPRQLSVLIVTYNSATTIRECIQSIFSTGGELDLEVIVVDNHSQDETVEILHEAAHTYPDLVLKLNRSNRGYAVGNNQALEMSHGRHVLILNPDTVVLEGVLQGLLIELEKHSEIGVVAPQLQFPDGRLQKTCRRFPTHKDVIYNVFGLASLYPASARFNGWKMGDFDHRSRKEVEQPAGAALLVRGDLLRTLNGFDENFPMFFNDVDLCKRIKDHGFSIWYIPELVMHHLGGVSVKQARLKMTLSSHVSFFRYFEKHFTRMHQQPLNFVVGILLYLSLIPRLLVFLLFKDRRTASRETL